MNEQRIGELVYQASAAADEATNALNDDTGAWSYTWNDTYDRKFAELIIRECLEVIRLVPYQAGGPKFGDEFVYQAALAEHFKIEG